MSENYIAACQQCLLFIQVPNRKICHVRYDIGKMQSCKLDLKREIQKERSLSHKCANIVIMCTTQENVL